jgi:site-specific recombinase XerD
MKPDKGGDMLEKFFDAPVTLGRLRNNPLGRHLDSFAGSLADLGYTTSTGIAYLAFSATFGQWLARNEIAITDIDERIVETFLDERGEPRFGGRTPALRHLLAYLREKAVLPSIEVVIDESPLALLEGRYERYLRVERGLTTATVVNYLPFVRRFLVERFGDGELRLPDSRPSDISSFILRHAHSMSLARAKLMATALRSFFRFLLGRGVIAIDLAACVPTVANRRLSTVPKYLEPEAIQRVLGSCDRDQPTGRRDYAILLLLVRLGLRAGEVVALMLDDIDWRAGQITIAGKGLLRDPMPLPTDVGQALARYLRQDRPACSSRQIFIRRWAPHRGFAHPSTVSTIARRALERAGLHPRSKGAHLFRHSLATGMLRQGGTLSEIGEVLRHRTPNTTEIYAKVDLVGLRSVAQVWPESWGG